MRYNFFLLSALSFVFGCSPKLNNNRIYVQQKVQEKYGYTISQAYDSTILKYKEIPESQAISLALYNNPQFQADLATIAIAEADYIEAGTLSNPVLRYLLPAGRIEVSGYINFAFDYLWQRPKRIAFAQAEVNRVRESLLQKGYAIIRDVQITYADLALAKEKAVIYAENARIRAQMNAIQNSRVRHGEISELEALTNRADSAAAIDDYYKASLDTILTHAKLNTLLGFAVDTNVVYALSDTVEFLTNKIDPDNVLTLALENNPEIKTALLSIESFGKKMGWEKSRIVSFIATLNFQHIPGTGGVRMLPNAVNPGFQIEIPVANRNQGRIARAKAELEQSSYQYIAIRQRIMSEVMVAYRKYEQALQSYAVWNTSVIPLLEEAVRLSNISFSRGDISLLPVLEAMRQLINSRLRKAEIAAQIRRSLAELNYSIGKKIN